MDEEKTAVFADDNDAESGDAQGELIGPDWDEDGGGDASDGKWDGPADAEGGGAQERFTLKHLGQAFEVSKEEVIALAQKGRDYDRIRTRAESLAERLAITETNGLPPEQRDAARARDRDVEAFFAEYGNGFDPRSIPPEVWRRVENGKPLLSAYQSYENRLLREKLGADAKNAENHARAAGSRSTDGATAARGELENDWYTD
ncbi:MAG: hypothetical protein LBT12_08615 [Oscillospiraceae bacterium]|jgi:hypothetical protein|nr:hypothetical protein [Oscillospiraceae bacterium]